ncbi:MAG: aminotransferase class V-fold PLP-dependent enzyme [Actinobacteria bacterium]|nr:aminotransferase class V-fold PLP-dependent enzyme [Actinomycetota bacterium]
MAPSMHEWDPDTNLFAHSVIGYAIERLQLPKDTRWGALPADELAVVLRPTITPTGVGGLEALRVFRDVLLPACRPMDDPMNLAYVPTAPSVAATMFDLVVSASSIFGGAWEAGAGAIAAENQAIRWLADLAGFPDTAGGVFVSGGSAANLSALVTAREVARATRTPSSRWTVAVTEEVHASVRAAARVMDVDILTVPVDAHGRLTGAALEAVLAEHDGDGVFAVVATGGTTNAGVIDELDAIADVCDARDMWLHVDGAYGLAGLCSAIARERFRGIERADSFGVDPHKWLFAPYDCAALVYRDPAPAAATHAQHGTYLDAVDRGEWNPSDYAYHLSRRARGLPLWFSLATYGTAAYTEAVDASIRTARAFADDVASRPGFTLLLEPELSVVLFTVDGWTRDDYLRWSRERARAGVALLVPTSWQGEPCLRICLVHPRTQLADLLALLDDLAAPHEGRTW